MFRSDEYRFLFIHIPKTGGTSIKKALLPYANPGQLAIVGEKVMDGKGFRPHLPLTPATAQKYSDYLKFMVVRNPWARYVSLYKFLKSRDRDIVRNKEFSTFVMEACSGRGHYARTQMQYGYSMMNQVLMFEHLQNDFSLLCRKLDLPDLELEHLKNQGDYNYRTMYTDMTRQMVKTHCHEVIRRYKYRF